MVTPHPTAQACGRVAIAILFSVHWRSGGCCKPNPPANGAIWRISIEPWRKFRQLSTFQQLTGSYITPEQRAQSEGLIHSKTRIAFPAIVIYAFESKSGTFRNMA